MDVTVFEFTGEQPAQEINMKETIVPLNSMKNPIYGGQIS